MQKAPRPAQHQEKRALKHAAHPARVWPARGTGPPPTPARCGASLPLHQAGILPRTNRVPGTAPRRVHGPAPCPSIPSAAASLPCSLFNSFYFKPRAGAALAAAAGGDGTGTQRAGTKDTRPAAPQLQRDATTGKLEVISSCFPKKAPRRRLLLLSPSSQGNLACQAEKQQVSGKAATSKATVPREKGPGGAAISTHHAILCLSGWSTSPLQNTSSLREKKAFFSPFTMVIAEKQNTLLRHGHFAQPPCH